MDIIRTDMNPRGASVVIKEPLTSGRGYEYMQVYHHMTDIDEWSFRRMRHENDALANWVSPERVSWYFTVEVEEAAKQVCLKAERRMELARNAFKKTDLYSAMEREVNHTVTSYRDDFFMHDCTRIGLMLLDGGKVESFRWYLRDSGTWLFTGEIGDGEAEVIKQKRHRVFHFDGDKLKEQTCGATYEPRPWYLL